MSASADEIALDLVRPEGVEQAWPTVSEFIAAACRRGPGRLDPIKLRAGCILSTHDLWRAVSREKGVVGAAVTTVIDDKSEGLSIEWVAFGAKDMRALYDLERFIVARAKEYGAARFRSYSRVGMQKRMIPLGYRVTGVILEKEI